jgi:uncharacterized Zn-binding protein involved in type VI secretion
LIPQGHRCSACLESPRPKRRTQSALQGETAMGRPLIVLGDKTSHGGVVIEASSMTDTHGKRIARVGDKVTCPKKGHGRVTTIATGDPTLIVDGAPAARHGDLCACGAKLLAGQYVTVVDEGNGIGAQSSSSWAESAAEKPSAVDELHTVRFQAVDGVTGEPLPQCPYVICRPNGTQHGGLTDTRGFTAPIQNEQAENVAVHFSFSSPARQIEREDLS